MHRENEVDTEVTRPGSSLASRVEALVTMVEAKLESGELKASLGDYIRLLQLARELKEEEPVREIKVTWAREE